MDDGIERGVQPVDQRNRRLDQFGRRDLTAMDQGGQIEGVGVGIGAEQTFGYSGHILLLLFRIDD
jgi:hypothetical protein